MLSISDLHDVDILDVAASGLGPESFPIDVGCAFLVGPPESELIRPAYDWDVQAWDDDAEALHRLTLDEIIHRGRAARDVAEGLNRRLAPLNRRLLVLSDAPEQDAAWLDRLFEETPEARRFELVDEIRARPFKLDTNLESMSAARPHRAEADALAMALVWRTALAQRLADEPPRSGSG